MTAPQAPRRIVAGIAIVLHEGKLLAGLRPESLSLGGMWEFPGGKVEPGESPAQAACRECQEETGLAVAEEGEIVTNVESYPHAEVELHFVRCRVLADLPPREPFVWLPINEACKLPFPSGNASLLAWLLAGGGEVKRR